MTSAPLTEADITGDPARAELHAYIPERLMEPDFVSRLTQSAVDNVLERSADLGIALDWATTRITMHPSTDRPEHIFFAIEVQSL